MRAFIAALVVSFVVMSAFSGGRTPQRRMAGIVVAFHEGESLSVTSEMTDLAGMRFTLRETTVYEGEIKPGVTVAVWYRSVAERQPVADKVRVLGER